MNRIYQLACQFRRAMEQAKKEGVFRCAPGFKEFPLGSCGNTCDLLAEYLMEFGIYTEYVAGMYRDVTHAWLVVADKEAIMSKRYSDTHSKVDFDNEEANDYDRILSLIKNGRIMEREYIPPDYASELNGRVIIDITGDQFSGDKYLLYYDKPVYVGEMDEMHSLFEIDDIYECKGLSGVGDLHFSYFNNLYRKIKKYL